MKILMCAFAVVPFAVAAVLLCTSGQNAPVKYKLGPVAWTELEKITGGAEGNGCSETGSNGGKVDTGVCSKNNNSPKNACRNSLTGEIPYYTGYSGSSTYQVFVENNTKSPSGSSVNCYYRKQYSEPSGFFIHSVCGTNGSCDTDTSKYSSNQICVQMSEPGGVFNYTKSYTWTCDDP